MRRRHCAGLGQPRQFIKHAGLPEFGIVFRRKAIQIERIHRRLHLRQAVERVAQHQGQLHPPAIKRDTMKSRRQHRPVRQQFTRKICKLRPLRMQTRQVGGLKRMFFDRQKMQPRRAEWVRTPRGPGRQKIQAGAKAGFQNDK